MKKVMKAIAAIMLTIAVVCAAGCKKNDDPNNGGNDNGGNGGDNGGGLNGHEYVDLGLPSGTLWASCNVGANSPENYGDYFAWGETESKTTYNWGTYKYCNGSYDQLTKYCGSSSYYGYNGYQDELTVLQIDDDVATVIWGEGWRMPTEQEWDELITYCNESWSVKNGVRGRLFTAANGNSIFLPSAGGRNEDELYVAGVDGYYWSSTLCRYMLYYYKAYIYSFGEEGIGIDRFDRFYGLSVRPVRSAK